jgi:hypothetical protein
MQTISEFDHRLLMLNGLCEVHGEMALSLAEVRGGGAVSRVEDNA